jgi:hypothetical protein
MEFLVKAVACCCAVGLAYIRHRRSGLGMMSHLVRYESHHWPFGTTAAHAPGTATSRHLESRHRVHE